MAESRISHLRHLDAGHIVDDRIDFDGLDVRNASGEKLGAVEGFIVQRDTNRPYYVVVDSGGWFSSRHYLLPIGHVRFDPDNQALRVDMDRDTITGFPEVQLDRFDELSEEEARRINEQTLTACCPNEVAARTGDDRWDYDRWSHYRQPDWWQARPASELPPPPLTNRPLAEDYDPGVVRTSTLPPASISGYEQEHVIAQHDENTARREAITPAGRDDERRYDRTAAGTPPEDRLDRAQPGDVLGVETAGETTSLGDTGRDEDERREDAEDANRELQEERREEERRRRKD
ncbi:MAG TPA: PRC-barrel domain-containing protein [Vicinamibacterales bacterium]|nr:PRC-barrel domain-containing protein [Vicinamibacterales bacterium]